MYTVLRDTSDTLSQHLTAALQATPGTMGTAFAPGGGWTVSLNTPEEMRSAGAEGLSVWLNCIVRDEQRLNAPPRQVGVDQWHRSLPVRLHYLMTPILATSTADSPETEQLILGRVLQVLHDRTVFRGADLAGELAGEDAELRVRWEPISLEEVTRIWDALDSSYQLSISYEVTVAYIQTARTPARITEVAQAMAVNAGPSAGLGVLVAEDEAP